MRLYGEISDTVAVNDCGPKARSSETQMAVELLRKQAEELSMTVARLTERLGPVLRDEPVSGLLRSDHKSAPACPLAVTLRDVGERFGDVQNQMTRLIEGIDL